MERSELFKHFIHEAFMIVQGEYYGLFFGKEDRSGVWNKYQVASSNLASAFPLEFGIGAHSLYIIVTMYLLSNANGSLCLFRKL